MAYQRVGVEKPLLDTKLNPDLKEGFFARYHVQSKQKYIWSVMADEQCAEGLSTLESLISELPASSDASALLETIRRHQLSSAYSNHSFNPSDYGVTGAFDVWIDEPAQSKNKANENAFYTTLCNISGTHIIFAPEKKSRWVLSSKKLPAHCVIVRELINPYSLFERAQQVHVMNSHLGMEALIAEKPVTTYAAPFFSGWGLTHDNALPADISARRTTRPTITQLCDAAYMRYPRYIDPYTHQETDCASLIQHMIWLHAQEKSKPFFVHAAGFPRWKRGHVRPFLAPPDGTVIFHNTLAKAQTAALRAGGTLAVWASKENPHIAHQTLPIMRLEDGFIRSSGLGSDLIAAASLVCDKTGIYFDATRPSDLENILNAGISDAALLARAARLRTLIIERSISKYNLPNANVTIDAPAGRPVHLVVGQVEEDASIRLGAGEIRTNQALLEAVRKRHPNAWIVYKPHPDVVAGNRKAGKADKHPHDAADFIITHGNLCHLFPQIERLHTITSLSGFECLLHGGNVTCYGTPFYAGWGLTQDVLGAHPRRNRKLMLDELVAATLILYPYYYDWQRGIPCPPEHCIEQLSASYYAHPIIRKWQRFVRWLEGMA